MAAMLTVYLDVCTKKSQYEESIVQVEIVSPTERNITIPAYDGSQFIDELYNRFGSIVGKDNIGQVRAAIEPTLYARNFGFGEAQQRINVKLLEGQPITYAFLHDVDTIHLPGPGNATVAYRNVDTTVGLTELGRYVGMMDLLPKGGS